MSNSVQTAKVQRDSRSSVIPKAIIHKKILDAAEQEPDATINELATKVNGATPGLIGQVLDRYGDPAGNQLTYGTDTSESEPSNDGSAVDDSAKGIGDDQVPRDLVKDQRERDNIREADDDATPDVADDSGDTADDTAEGADDGLEKDDTRERSIPNFGDLTEKQRETIHAISEDPEATQKELAKQFNVTSATICQRVNNIDGFDWKNRAQFAEKMIEKKAATENSADAVRDVHDQSDELDRLRRRIQTLERDLEQQSRSPERIFDANLLHKVIHACVRSEHISEEEELEILKRLTDGRGQSE